MNYGYARVSTLEQAENSHALEQQVARLKAAGAEIIETEVASGSKRDRPVLLALVPRLREGDTLFLTRFDRLTRSLVQLRKLVEHFQEHKVSVVALDDPIDYASSAGKFHLNMLGALAEMEVDRLSERTRHGWQHLRSKAVAMNPPLGYRKQDDRHVLDHEPFLCLLDSKEERSLAQIAREIVDTFLEKQTLRMCIRTIYERYGIRVTASVKAGRVAREMFRFSVGGLSTWLRNPVLRGHVRYLRRTEREYIIPNCHEPLITDAEYREILRILEFNKRRGGFGSSNKARYPLSGLVFCGECNASCYSVTGATNYHRAKRTGEPINRVLYYQCKSWKLRACSQKTTIRGEAIEAVVIAALCSRSEDLAREAATPDKVREPVELVQLREQVGVLRSLPTNPAITRAIEELEQQMAALTRVSMEPPSVDLEAFREVSVAFRDPEYWRNLSDPDKAIVFRELVERVTMKDGKVLGVKLKV